ncbi:hypothetical protein GALMADRAFT_141618 [Galerina marginata CBS 339.88]|uniref:Uncharacterized protein n=1 Tax=Galerina marginata (strain CBS 339.88) TaxID=685588 RepID=A0A067SSA5_GALM3|nr:hypothetical protein GALMADRAFT_141618 [Galerina marginata CBS 339.88]
MTSTAKKYLKFADESVIEPEVSAKNPPKGLYSLMLVATERAFMAHLPNGVIKASKDLEGFSDNYACGLTIIGHVDECQSQSVKDAGGSFGMVSTTTMTKMALNKEICPYYPSTAPTSSSPVAQLKASRLLSVDILSTVPDNSRFTVNFF